MLVQLPLVQLQPGQYQTRKDFNQEALAELAQSLRQQGMIQPIVVRALGPDSYEILAGERRYRAAMLAEMSSVPCLLHDCPDTDALAITTIENLQREDLNPIEEAKAFALMQQDFNYAHDEIGAIVGKSRSYITNTLRLLKLPPNLQHALISGALQVGHAKLLLNLSPGKQLHFAQQVESKAWSVRELERALKQVSADKGRAMRTQDDPDLSRLAELTSQAVGSEVQVESTSTQSGWLKLKYYDNETLQGILERLGVKIC